SQFGRWREVRNAACARRRAGRARGRGHPPPAPAVPRRRCGDSPTGVALRRPARRRESFHAGSHAWNIEHRGLVSHARRTGNGAVALATAVIVQPLALRPELVATTWPLVGRLA